MVVTFHAKLLFSNLSKRITGFSDHSIKVRVVSFLAILTIHSLLEVLWSIFSVSLVVNLSAWSAEYLISVSHWGCSAMSWASRSSGLSFLHEVNASFSNTLSRTNRFSFAAGVRDFIKISQWLFSQFVTSLLLLLFENLLDCQWTELNLLVLSDIEASNKEVKRDCLLLCSYSFHNFVSDDLEKILHEICSAVTNISDGLETNSNQFFIEHLYKIKSLHREKEKIDLHSEK